MFFQLILRLLTICHFQQTIKKFGNFTIPESSKMIFGQKNEGFLSSCFTTDEETFVQVLNPSKISTMKINAS